jgi:hypothetical protein
MTQGESKILVAVASLVLSPLKYYFSPQNNIAAGVAAGKSSKKNFKAGSGELQSAFNLFSMAIISVFTVLVMR